MRLANIVKKYMKELQVAYESGLCAYPRTDNDYIEKEKTFEYFPHPKLFVFNSFLRPLQKRGMKLDKKSAMLFLSNIRLALPSQLVSQAQIIDDFFHDNLSFIPKMDNKFERIYRHFKNFMKDKILMEDTLPKKERYLENLYAQAHRKMPFGFYKNNSISFIDVFSKTKKGTPGLRSYVEYHLKKAKSRNKKKTDINPSQEMKNIELPYLSDALLSFRVSYNEILRRRKEEEKQYSQLIHASKAICKEAKARANVLRSNISSSK